MEEVVRLRFGIVCRGRQLAAWQVLAIRHLRQQGNADLAAVAFVPEEANRAAGALWRLFSRGCRPRSLELEDISAEMQRAGLGPVDLSNIPEHGLDFIVNFVSNAPGDLGSRTRYGAWSFDLGCRDRDAWPPFFREISDAETTVSAALVSTGASGSAFVLREGHFRTIDYHYARSVDKLCFEAARWPAYVSRELARGGTERLQGAPTESRVRTYRLPSTAMTLKFLFVLAKNVVRRLFERRWAEEWNIGAVRMQPAELLDGTPMKNVRWLPAIAGGWAADPMAMRADGKVYVLFEEMQLRSGKGRISTTSFDGSSWSELKVAIETVTHASYPYLFEHDGSIYCVPETFEAREIALYRARRFPMDWERVATLVSGLAAVDATLFEHDGLFWLFCTTSESSDTVLLAFFAKSLWGPWSTHQANPVKIDVRGSRPAGAPFRVDGTLYRPAQDCSKTYGGRVVVHRVVALSPTEFREEPCAYAEPIKGSPYEQGLHTLSFAGEYCIIDGKRRSR